MDLQYEIIDKHKGIELRKLFIKKFVDENINGYKTNIASVNYEDDSSFYQGYLWDYFKNNCNYELECTLEEASEYLRTKNKIYIMWDVFSDKYIRDFSYFSQNVARNSVIQMDAQLVSEIINREWNNKNNLNRVFPEDIYCFDENMEWCVVFTHEEWDAFTAPDRVVNEDDYIRICFKV